MNTHKAGKSILATSIMSAAVLGLTACGAGVSIPDPTAADYNNQAMMQAAHPGMDCVMEWVDPGQYMTNCYPMTYHPPYSVRVYYPKGCTCPATAPRPNNYRPPRPVVINKTTNVTVNQNSNNKTVVKPPAPAPAKPAPQDKVPNVTNGGKR